jgi:hypothetical protein
MAKKSTKTIEEKAVAPVQVEDVTPEVVKVEETKAETVKSLTIIANEPIAFRKIMSLETKYIIGQMPMGVAYEIVRETSSKIYGDFYLLNNGYYITKSGNYTIN